MKAIVTVVGKDQVGIIAGVCNTLADHGINVLDISQTIMEGYFTMMMVVDLALCDEPFASLQGVLKAYGEGRGLSIRIPVSYTHLYHPGAAKYFAEKDITVKTA